MKKTLKAQKTAVHSRKKSGILMGSIAMLLAPFAGHADDYIVNGTADVTGAGYFDGLGGGNVILQSGQLNVSIGGYTQPLPKTISGLNSWFSAESLSLSNGASVDSWTDLSGNGHDATRSQGQMTFTTNSVNGLPTVNFRGNGIGTLSGSLYAAQEYAVFTLPNEGDWGAIIGSNDSNQGYLMNREGYMWGGRPPRAVSKDGTALSGDYNVGNNNGYMVIKIDNRNGNTSATSGWTLGGQEDWNSLGMNLAEVLTFDHDLSAPDEQAIGGYLAARYGVSTSYTPYGGYTGITSNLTTSGNLNLTSSNIIVEGSTVLNAVTDGSASFGALSFTPTGGVVTVQGSPDGISFTSTSVGAGVSGGVDAKVGVTLGAITIGNGGTFSRAGTSAATTTGITLSGATGTVSVGSGASFNLVAFNDGGLVKTLILGGAGTKVVSNNANAFTASNTTFRVTGGTVDATNSGGNDPLGGSNTIQLAGGKLMLRGEVTIGQTPGINAGWFTNVNSGSLNLDNATYTRPQDRPFAGSQGVLAETPAGTNLGYTGEVQGFGALGAGGDNFATAWSGTLIPNVSGNHFFRWDNDDQGALYIDFNNDGTFQPSDRVGSIEWHGSGTANLTAGTEYNFIYMSHEDGGGESNNFWVTQPGFGEEYVNPSGGNQTGMWNVIGEAIAALNFTSKTVSLDASSELNAQSNSSAAFGALTMNAGTLTLSGAPSISFTGTTIAPGATQVGISNGTTVTPNLGVIDGSGASVTFTKSGTGTFVLNSSNHDFDSSSTFDVQGGKLVVKSMGGLGGAGGVKLSGTGVELYLSSPDSAEAYDISLDVTQDGTLRAAKYSGSEATGATITLGSAGKNLTVRNGKTLTLATADSYALDINNSLVFEDNSTMNISTVGSGANINVNILGATTLTMGNNSTLNLNAGTMHTNHAINVYNLNLNGGILSLEGTGADKSINVNGTLKLDNGATNLDLTGGAQLTTSGNATINIVNGTITTDSALNVGNLTVEAGGTLNLAGALAADRNVTVSDKLRLVNKSLNTTGSTLSVGNRIELENSTLTHDSNLSLNSVWMNSNSHYVPAAGTTTTINDVIEIYNGSTADFTGSTLALGNRFRLEGTGATLTVRNNLSLNGDSEIYQGALVDLGTYSLNNNFRELRIANNNSELRATNSSTIDISYLQVWDGGKLNVPSVRINNYVWLGVRANVAANISEDGGARRLEAHQGGLNDSGTDQTIYLTGTNTYTGETQIHDATVLAVGPNALPADSMLRFYNGAIGTSGTFTRTIGDGAGQVRFDSYGGFAAYGGDLTVSLGTQANGANAQLYWNSYDEGFNNQNLYLGSAFATHNVTLTNAIEINSEAHIQTWSPTKLSTLSGNLTGGSILWKEGRGTLMLSGTNSTTGLLAIRRGAIDVGLNGANHGTGPIQLWADNADNDNKGAIFQGYGAFNFNIGSGNGEIRWEENGGGFAARGGALTVTLNGPSAVIGWNDDPTGFRGKNLMFGSGTADNVTTFTNDIDAQNGHRYIYVFDNPNSSNDKAVLSGNLTDFRGFDLHGDGVLEINNGSNGGFSVHDDNLNVNDTATLRVIGNLISGNVDTSDDLRYLPSGAFNNVEVNSGNLYVAGNVQANYFYGGGNVNGNINITGNVALRNRLIQDQGTTHIGGNLTMGEDNMYVRNRTNMTVDGNLRVGAPSGNYADRSIYIENGGDLTVGGILSLYEMNITGKNDLGRSSSLHVNGTAYFQNRIYMDGENTGRPTSGGRLDGSGTIHNNYIEVRGGSAVGGNLTLDLSDRLYIRDNGWLTPGNESVGTLTMTRLELNGGGHYNFDGGDMIFTTSNLRVDDNWYLDIKTGGQRLVESISGSIPLFTFSGQANPESFDFTPNFNVADLIAAGWISNSFDTGTLSLSQVGNTIVLNGLQAEPSTWNGGSATTSNWTDGDNWTLAAQGGYSLRFAGSVRTTANNDFAAGTTFASLEFTNTAAPFTLTGNSINLGGNITNNSSNNQVINVPMAITASNSTINTGANNVTLGAAVSGNGNVIKTGAGTLIMSGANTYAGTTQVNEGTVQVNGSLAAGGLVSVPTGGTLGVSSSSTVARSVTVTGGVVNLSGALTAGTLTLTSGTVTASGSNAAANILALPASGSGATLSATSGNELGVANKLTQTTGQNVLTITAGTTPFKVGGSNVVNSLETLVLQGDNTTIEQKVGNQSAGLAVRAWQTDGGLHIDGSLFDISVEAPAGSSNHSTFANTIGYATEAINQGGDGEHFGNGRQSGVPDSATRPGGYSDNLAVEYRGKLYLASAGTYRFATSSDDGSALWIDQGDVSTSNPSYGTAAVQNNYGQGMTRRESSQLTLDAGYHDFVVRFNEGGGGNALAVEWDPTGGTNWQPIPGANYFYGTQTVASVNMPTTAVSVTSTSTLTLNGGGNAVLGNLSVSSGTLTLAGDGVTGVSFNSISATGNGAISGASVRLHSGQNDATVSGSNTLTVNSVISQTNASDELHKLGTGTLILAASNTYAGDTVVEAGTLLVNGSISGSTLVSDGGTLGGNGTTGPVNLDSGGTLSPGASIGELTVGTLSVNPTGVVKIEVNSTTVGLDKLNVNGDLNIGVGAVLNVVEIGSGALTLGTTGVIIDYTGTLTGTFAGLADDISFAVGENIFQISYDGVAGGETEVTLTVVPEPGAAISLLGGLGLLLGVRRRRK